MIVYVLVLAIQIACVVDVIRNGRNQLWIMALVFLPIASMVAYAIVEVLPRLQNNRHVRIARANVSAALDPDREVRAARAALDMADTAANRIRVADALTALGRHDEALPCYREVIARGRPICGRARSSRAPGSRPAMPPVRSTRSTPIRRRPRRATATGKDCCARGRLVAG